jgi:D-alanyl-D-alanine endopeptidase (penicillin-binding protein 7)
MRWILILAMMANVAVAKPVRPTPNSESVLLLNTSTNHIELSRNADRVRAIASITKIMTAMVALDYDKDLSRRLTLTKRVGSYLPRQQYTREQLLEAMLVKSDNAAAETLAEDYPGGRTAFIARMNSQAQAWDLKHTQFEDASGLGAANTSTVHDVAAMITLASNYWFIRETSTKKQVALETRHKKQIRTIRLDHTSGNILFTFDNIVVSKTGLTSAAGWCVGLVANQRGQQYVIVVLGSRTKIDRLNTVKNIMYNHVLDQNLQPQEFANTYY